MTDPMLNRHAMALEESFERLRRLEKMVTHGVPRGRGRPGRMESIAKQIRRGGVRLPSPFGLWGESFEAVPEPTPEIRSTEIKDRGRQRALERMAEAAAEYRTGHYSEPMIIEINGDVV